MSWAVSRFDWVTIRGDVREYASSDGDFRTGFAPSSIVLLNTPGRSRSNESGRENRRGLSWLFRVHRTLSRIPRLHLPIVESLPAGSRRPVGVFFLSTTFTVRALVMNGSPPKRAESSTTPWYAVVSPIAGHTNHVHLCGEWIPREMCAFSPRLKQPARLHHNLRGTRNATGRGQLFPTHPVLSIFPILTRIKTARISQKHFYVDICIAYYHKNTFT